MKHVNCQHVLGYYFVTGKVVIIGVDLQSSQDVHSTVPTVMQVIILLIVRGTKIWENYQKNENIYTDDI